MFLCCVRRSLAYRLEARYLRKGINLSNQLQLSYFQPQGRQCYESHPIRAAGVSASKMGSLEHESPLPPAHVPCAMQRKSLGCDKTERITGSN